MLTDLFGSKSAERILLFLLVNEYCFPSEVQRACKVPLTPLQSSFRKLEKAGILLATMQRKNRLYRFNQEYPLLSELRSLLKKAFIHLPPEEKRTLFSRKEQWRPSLKDHYAHQKKVAVCLDSFWSRLTRVKSVTIQTQTDKQAFGEVSLSNTKKDHILFTIQGSWMDMQMGSFNNVLRWSIDRSSSMIALEHLRYGPDRPVFLFHLAPIGPNTLQSIDSHLCSEDCYYGRIEFTEQHIRFLWRILGPRKNEVLYHTYL